MEKQLSVKVYGESAEPIKETASFLDSFTDGYGDKVGIYTLDAEVGSMPTGSYLAYDPSGDAEHLVPCWMLVDELGHEAGWTMDADQVPDGHPAQAYEIEVA